MFSLKRVYDPPEPGDGKRFLVDRVWPRGVSKDKAALAGWLKDVSPSGELRHWFGHDPAKWDEFRRRYREELAVPEAQAGLERLRREAEDGAVTLVFAAKDTEHNNAVALKQFLTQG